MPEEGFVSPPAEAAEAAHDEQPTGSSKADGSAASQTAERAAARAAVVGFLAPRMIRHLKRHISVPPPRRDPEEWAWPTHPGGRRGA